VVLLHNWGYDFNTLHQADLFAAVASWHLSLVSFANLLCGAHYTVRFFSDNDSLAPSTLSLPARCTKGTPVGPSSSHWCFNARLRPLLQHILP
jgi:hypothetical protein